MRKHTGTALVVAAVFAVMFMSPYPPAIAGPSALSMATSYDGDTVAVTAVSQRVQTGLMRLRNCTAWRFINKGGADIYIDANNTARAATASVTSVGGEGTRQFAVYDGETVFLDEGLIKQFRVIGSGAVDLEFHCGCDGG